MSHPPSLPHLTYDIARKLDAEIGSARAKYPNNKHTLAALMEETGELAQALLQAQPREDIRKEALQVAATALRIYMEGDHYIDTDHVLSTDEQEEADLDKMTDAIMRDLFGTPFDTSRKPFWTSVKESEAKKLSPSNLDKFKVCPAALKLDYETSPYNHHKNDWLPRQAIDDWKVVSDARVRRQQDELDALRFAVMAAGYGMRPKKIRETCMNPVLGYPYGMSTFTASDAYQVGMNHMFRLHDMLKINNVVHRIDAIVTQIHDEFIVDTTVVFSPKRAAEYIHIDFALFDRDYGRTIVDIKTAREVREAQDMQLMLYQQMLPPYAALDARVTQELHEMLEEYEAERIDNEFEELWKQRVTTLRFVGTLVDITISIPVVNLRRSYTLQSVTYNVIAIDELISRKIDEIRTELYETYVDQET